MITDNDIMNSDAFGTDTLNARVPMILKLAAMYLADQEGGNLTDVIKELLLGYVIERDKTLMSKIASGEIKVKVKKGGRLSL